MTQPKPDYRRGDVILVLYPDSNLQSAKTRPALIVQADDLGTGLSQVIIAMVTSRLMRANHPCRVAVFLTTPEGQQSGLLTDSVIMTDNLATITNSAIFRVIGSLPMSKVDKALSYTLGL